MSTNISIIVPVYNAEEFLPRCLDSIAAQTLNSIEVILVNDGSQGNCSEIYSTYKQKLNIIYLAKKKNEGLFQARIDGLLHATGKYVYNLDADDWIQPTTCEDLFLLAEQHGADFVQGPRLEGTNEDDLKLFTGCDYHDVVMFGQNIFDSFMRGGQLWSACGKLFRRSLYLKALLWANLPCGLNINNAEGYLFVLIFCIHAQIFVRSGAKGAYCYYTNPHSLSRKFSKTNEQWNKFFTDMCLVQNISYGLYQRLQVPPDLLDAWKARREAFIKNYMEITLGLKEDQRCYFLYCLHKIVREDTEEFFFSRLYDIYLRCRNCDISIEENYRSLRNIKTFFLSLLKLK
ncbi:MAG: glycosyltransferase family 2 protein [Desulfovibrio sp.]|uniref:glycosyltransferase family 2 protein n=1 Tax=Desulfovibrio sp. TaxID=885 RepID=UPI001A71616A|nr:glycosyltransferase family 2 protein [Desulfovibrio sp.]MBD5416432.1 glycosyltransferase family 2 protein [Desulfovibrio sp.]